MRTLLLASDPVLLPATGGFKDLGVRLIYDLERVLGLADLVSMTAVWGAALTARDRDTTRERRRLQRDWDAAWPQDDKACTTAEEYAAYDAAEAAYRTALAANVTAREAVARDLALATIAHVLVRVEWSRPDDQPPDPADPASWAEWPTAALRWISEQGVGAAQEQLRGKTLGARSITTTT